MTTRFCTSALVLLSVLSLSACDATGPEAAPAEAAAASANCFYDTTIETDSYDHVRYSIFRVDGDCDGEVTASGRADSKFHNPGPPYYMYHGSSFVIKVNGATVASQSSGTVAQYSTYAQAAASAPLSLSPGDVVTFRATHYYELGNDYVTHVDTGTYVQD